MKAKSKTKSKLNVKLLRKIQKFILAEPRRFFMTYGVEPAETLFISAGTKAYPPCGTTCCIAGAAYIIENKIEKTLSKTRVEWEIVRNTAVKVLGIPDRERTEKLFYDEYWPLKFKIQYDDAETPLQRAKVGVARIEHFIKTDGRE